MAEYVYPAIFHQNKDGSFTITYPDLPGCISEGKSLGNAMYMAQTCLLYTSRAAQRRVLLQLDLFRQRDHVFGEGHAPPPYLEGGDLHLAVIKYAIGDAQISLDLVLVPQSIRME